jgi:acyl carrier protein
VDTFKRVQAIIADKLGVSPETVRVGSKASDLREWDSVNHIMIISDIEEAFDFKFRLEEIAEMDSVPKLVQAIDSRGAR